MLRLGSFSSVIRGTVKNLSSPNSRVSSLRPNNALENASSNTETTTLKLYAVNLIQTRHRHVMDDAMEPHRTFRHDKKTGLKTSSDIVLKKFFRLRWGVWIRTVGGKNKDLWQKDLAKHRLYKKHVFCKAKESTLLDKMVTDEYKEPHYYVDDPYEPYHNRNEFMYTRTKPLPPSKNVYQHLDD